MMICNRVQVPVKYNEKTDEVIRVDVVTPGGGGNGGNVDSDATAGGSQGSNSSELLKL